MFSTSEIEASRLEEIAERTRAQTDFMSYSRSAGKRDWDFFQLTANRLVEREDLLSLLAQARHEQGRRRR